MKKQLSRSHPFLWPLQALAIGIAVGADEAAAPMCSETDSPGSVALSGNVVRGMIRYRLPSGK